MKTGIFIMAVLFLCAAPDAALSQPPNDNFANATVLTGVSGQVSGTNVGATKESGEPDHTADNTGITSVWYSWTAPETGAFYFDTHGSTFDTVLAVYTGSSVNGLTQIASNDDDGSGIAGNNDDNEIANDNSSLVFRAETGIRYYVAVDGWDGNSGEIILNWRKANPPANDDFANADVLTGVSGSTTSTNIEATSETGEDIIFWGLEKSVWWKWTAPESGAFYFDTHGSSFDTYLAVYTGSAVDSLTKIASNNDDGSDNGNSSLAFRANAGTVFYIAVCGDYYDYDNDDYASGSIVLNWRKANDSFADATELSGISGQITGANVDATKEPGEPYYLEKSVWYSWTAPETGAFYFDTHGSSFDTTLAVYIGSAVDSLTLIAGNRDDGSDNGNSSLSFRANAGTVFYIAVCGDYDNGDYASGDIVLNWRKANPPANDNFADAIELTGISGQITGTNVDATIETGENAEKSVWWKWTTPETGAFYFDTHGSGFDTYLAVYTGSALGSLTKIAGNNNDGNSSLAFRAETGTNYYIAVDGYNANSGSIILNWRKANPPANDNFADAIELTGISGQTTGSNIEATAESGEPYVGYGESVW
ncbi:MAG: hypothetical protein BWK80_34190, partial [Desulfobacteraceae bacterium IS3]